MASTVQLERTFSESPSPSQGMRSLAKALRKVAKLQATIAEGEDRIGRPRLTTDEERTWLP